MNQMSKLKFKAMHQIMKAVKAYHKTGVEQKVEIKMAKDIYISAIDYYNNDFYIPRNQKLLYTIDGNYIKISFIYNTDKSLKDRIGVVDEIEIDTNDPDDVEW